MKTGIVTIYDVSNYGSVLQAYATQKLLEEMGLDSVFIDYDRRNKWYTEKSHRFQDSFIRRFVRKLGLKAAHRKAIKLEQFKSKYFNKSRKYKDLDDLCKEDWSEYGAFVVGSDQVWNPRYLCGDSVFMLSFAPDEAKKLSIASSFASARIPEQYLKKYTRFLSRFDAISVREANGVNIIKEQLNLPVDARQLLDPTLLLSDKQWLASLPATKQSNGKYILLYILAYAFEPRPYIYEVSRYYKQLTGYDVIALSGYDKMAPTDLHISNRGDANVPEFVNLFANAELVITSSFHGTAFAANFGKPLISVIPEGGDDRQMSLLKSLGMKNCAVSIGKPLAETNPYYDVSKEQGLLNEIRQENINWIKQQFSTSHCSNE